MINHAQKHILALILSQHLQFLLLIKSKILLNKLNEHLLKHDFRLKKCCQYF